jgi:hypothetical protein
MVGGIFFLLEKTRLRPYFTSIGNCLTKSPTFYLRDSGMLNHLPGLHSCDAQLGLTSAGGSFEGFGIELVPDGLNPTQSACFFWIRKKVPARHLLIRATREGWY